MRFSVVIPTHQRRDVVVRNVAALARQSLEDFEAIVVVDGSTDGTADALRAMDAGFPLTVLEQPNSGAAAARNAGAVAASGEILLFLDDDMEADPALLAEHDRAHRDGADLVLGDVPLHPDSPRNVLSDGVASWARARRDRLAAADAVPLEDLLTGQMSVARERFERLGGFDSAFTRGGAFGGEDVDFGYRLYSDGCRVVFTPEAVSRQLFDVDPAVYLRREYDAGRSAVELAVKHPARAGELLGSRRLATRRSRVLLGPLVVAPRAVSAPVRSVVGRAVGTGRGGPRLSRTFQAVRAMEHLRGARAARAALSTGEVVVLAYHAIQDVSDDTPLGDWSVSPARFAAQLDTLLERGWTFVDLDAVLRALDGDGELPARSALVTFDDVYAHLREAALPVLAERGISATLFAVAGHVGGENDWDRAKGARRLELMGADGLRELAAAGHEIGSHGMTHRPLTSVPRDELNDELGGSADTLEALGLARPRAFAYPHGAWDATVAAGARDAAYAVAFAIDPGVVTRTRDRWSLPRVEVMASDSPRALALKVATAGWPPGLRRRALAVSAAASRLPGGRAAT
jgi:peptidoglycan/xylan/chitin deacetylase (PgdA/CDA1 family)/glycosyltransferase involved in cell wall biosynthesis